MRRGEERRGGGEEEEEERRERGGGRERRRREERRGGGRGRGGGRRRGGEERGRGAGAERNVWLLAGLTAAGNDYSPETPFSTISSSVSLSPVDLPTFASVTHHLVKNMDLDGNLIPVPSLNNSGKLTPLSLVPNACHGHSFSGKKQNKCVPTDYTQYVFCGIIESMLMLNFPSLVKETDIVDYSGTFCDSREASVDVGTQLATDAVDLNFNSGTQHASTLESSFGRRKKEEEEVKGLFSDSKDNKATLLYMGERMFKKESNIFINTHIMIGETCCAGLKY
ncbi:unnamed protein product [Coregonus sp. 'balchen']|nr:unnamed protein product [Coregonus sp. 'balchen']